MKFTAICVYLNLDICEFTELPNMGSPVVIQWSLLSFLSPPSVERFLFFFVSLLYKIRYNLSTTHFFNFKLSEFSDVL